MPTITCNVLLQTMPRVTSNVSALIHGCTVVHVYLYKLLLTISIQLIHFLFTKLCVVFLLYDISPSRKGTYIVTVRQGYLYTILLMGNESHLHTEKLPVGL